MFFRRKSATPEQLRAIADLVGEFMKLSIAQIPKDRICETDAAIIECFLLGAVDYATYASGLRNTDNVAKVTGLVLARHMDIGVDECFNRVVDIVRLSKGRAGTLIGEQGGLALQKALRDSDPAATSVLAEIIHGGHFKVSQVKD